MHKDKIWTIDLFEEIQEITGDDSEAETMFQSTLHFLTGGCDSTIKVWRDFTREHEEEEKEAELLRVRQEQELTHLIRQEDFVEAAVLAFKLNKYRDFFLILKKLT